MTVVQQPFDMALFLNRDIDAAEAMTYNEYAQVLEATNPDTGELYKPEDLNVVNFNDVGTAMLQDHIFTRASWLADNEDVAVRFLTASFQGWMYCRDNFDDCVQIVLDNGPTLGEGHMQWQLNEINNLIWPSPNGIGVMDPQSWQQTVDISTDFGVLQNPPDAGAYRTDLAQKALANIQGDTTGAGYQPLIIQLTPGGEAPGTIQQSGAMPETGGAATTQAACDQMTPVKLQLQWVTQSQFAGYYAAKEKGFYEAQCLDVTILEGAVDIVPQQVVASGDAQFGIAWVPKVLASREQGADLVNIGQVFQRSGTLEISWADSGITQPADWAGKRVGTWGFGNEFELFAAMRKVGIDPEDPNQVTVVQQPFDMALFLNRDIDAAEAMTYNEYAQVLEATNPDTGELYKPEDLNVVNFNDVGTAMLQDHIFTREAYLQDHEDVATRFLTASFQGWMYCRDNFDDCVQIVLDNGSTLGEGHMRWQLNEIQ